MDPQRWQRLDALFFDALALEPAARAAYLDQACGSDVELRLELESMLAAEEDSLVFALESRLLSDEPAPGAGDLIGTLVGPYRIEKLLGEGGMGEVYLAHKEEAEYDLKVALKLVRPGFRNNELVARFRVERQVLARLNHPNITQLLDGGVDAQGRPYLVMPFVAGVPITTFCDKNALSIEDRLALFRTVCSAVQYAHRNLVVHRDLKPSNILVTEDGTVKLLDFGIAKLLDPEQAIGAAVTRSQVRLMTPEYAAPEQVRGETITTATDVYALGVLLYELLSGRRPYRLGSWIQAEIERVICEEDPRRPSTAVTEIDPTTAKQPETSPEAVSRARRTGVSRLKKMLEGDLDTIVMMALRKEPDRRYASVEQFAQDIGRFLEGRPIAAQKDTAGYRFRKFVQRNRVAVGVVAGVFVLVSAFGAAMYRQAQVVAEERDRARLEAEKAQQVSQFLEALFDAPDPYAVTNERRDTLRVRDLLAEGVEKVRKDLATQPAVQAKLLAVLGTVHKSLGEMDTARPLLEEALAIRQSEAVDEPLDIAESQVSLGQLFKELGDYAPAESLYVLALETRRRLLPENDPAIAGVLNGIGTVRQDLGDYAAADSLYREALAIHRAALGLEHFDVTTDMNNLATVLYQQGNYGEAEPLFREVLEIRRRTLGNDHPDVAGSMSNMALVLHQTEQLEPAEALYRESLDIRKRILGDNHPDVAAGLNNLAAVLKERGDFAGAEPLYQQSIEIRRKLLGDVHPSIAVTLHNYASMLSEKGDVDRAKTLYLESLAMKRAIYGGSHPSTAATLNNLGTMVKDNGDLAEAEPYLREALAMNRELLPSDHPRLGMTLESLGDLLFRLGKETEAEPFLVEAMTIMRKTLPDDHARVVKTAGRLVELYDKRGTPAQADPYRALLAPADSTR